MRLFSKKEGSSAPLEARRLSAPATIVFTTTSIPANNKATYWFEVILNEQSAGRVDQNGVPATFTTMTDKNVLTLKLHMEIKGKDSSYPSPKQKLEVKDGETMRVLFENRRFIVG